MLKNKGIEISTKFGQTFKFPFPVIPKCGQ